MLRSRVAAVGAALVLVVSVAACGGGSDDRNFKDEGSYAGKKSGSFQLRECKIASGQNATVC